MVDEDQFFGFGYYHIQAPDIKIPFLTTHIPFNNINNLCSPTGKWAGWYFSEEINYARKLGYHIIFQHGWHYNKSYDLFHDYVHSLYK